MRTLLQDPELSQPAEAKIQGTGVKLRSMRDLYVGDEWENPTELAEWSGFFEGAAVVHWAIVLGAAEGTGNSSLKETAEKAIELHHELLHSAKEFLKATGSKRASV